MHARNTWNPADVRAAYERDGYVVIPGFKSPAEVAALRERAHAIVADFDPAQGAAVFSTKSDAHQAQTWFLDSGDAVRCFFEEEAFDADGRQVVPKARAINKIGHALHKLDPVFAPFSTGPDIVALMQALGVERPHLYQSMAIFKQPHIGGEVRWHQDATYLIAEPIPVTGLWFALEDATLDNGCLWVVKGGHRGRHATLREVYWRDGDDTKIEKLDATPWPTEAEATPVEVKAGAVVAFHGLMPHYSAPNRSAVSRLAYTLHFADGRSTWHPRNWLRTEQATVLG